MAALKASCPSAQPTLDLPDVECRQPPEPELCAEAETLPDVAAKALSLPARLWHWAATSPMHTQDYPTASLKELFRGLPVTAIALTCLSSSGALLLPRAWFDVYRPLDPTFVLCGGLLNWIPHVTTAVVRDMRLNIGFLVVMILLGLPSTWFYGIPIFGFLVAHVLFAIVTRKVAEQREIQIYSVLLGFPSISLLFVAMLRASRWISDIDITLVRVALFPLLSASASVCLPYVGQWVFEHFGRPGLPRYSLGLVMAFGQVVAEDMRLGAFLANARSFADLARVFALTAIVELLLRLPLWYKGLRLLGRAHMITACDDVRLRLRFTTHFLPLIPTAITLRVAEATGAPWMDGCWLALFLYLICNLLCDAVVVVLHRLREKDGAGLVAIWRRLSTQPRSHWRELQPLSAEEPMSATDNSVLHWPPWLPDSTWVGLQLHLFSAVFVWAVLSGLFGECHIWQHADHCEGT